MIVRGKRQSISNRLIVNSQIPKPEGVYTVNRLITSAEILDIDATPIVIVPAVENHYIIPIFWKLELRYNSIGYQTTPRFYLQTENYVNSVLDITNTDFLGSESDALYLNNINSFGTGFIYSDNDRSIVQNDNLIITSPSSITTGNSDVFVSLDYILY